MCQGKGELIGTKQAVSIGAFGQAIEGRRLAAGEGGKECGLGCLIYLCFLLYSEESPSNSSEPPTQEPLHRQGDRGTGGQRDKTA